MVSATGFAAGLRAGGGLVSQALENERLDSAADRQAEEFNWKKSDRAKAEADDAVQRGLRTQAMAAASGDVDAGTIQKIKDTYGANDAQIAQWRAAPGGLQGKLASFDAPDASELGGGGPGAGSAYGLALGGATPAPATPAADGGAPATGLGAPGGAPAGAAPYTAADVKVGEPNQKAVMDYGAQAALARGDWAGAAQLKAAGRAADIQSIQDSSVKEFMALSPEDRAKRAWSPNLTGNVPLLTTKVDKNGMTVLVVNPDGSTNGKPMQLSWADAAQLHAAETMASRGYGAEAIDTATKVNARIGEAIKGQNDVMQKVATTNTDAAYKGGQLGIEGAKLSMMREELGMKRDKAKQESTEVLGVTNDGVLNRNKSNGAVTLEPFPKGLPDDQKAMIIKKYRSVYEPKYSTDGQMMTLGPDTFDANPNYNKDPAKVGKLVNTTDKWLKTTPGAGGDVATAFSNLVKNGPAPTGAAAPPAAPAAEKPGLNVPKPEPSWLTSPAQAAAASYDRDKAARVAERAGTAAIMQVPSDQLRAIVQQGYGSGGANTQQLQLAAAELARRGERVNP